MAERLRAESTRRRATAAAIRTLSPGEMAGLPAEASAKAGVRAHTPPTRSHSLFQAILKVLKTGQ